MSHPLQQPEQWWHCWQRHYPKHQHGNHNLLLPYWRFLYGHINPHVQAEVPTVMKTNQNKSKQLRVQQWTIRIYFCLLFRYFHMFGPTFRVEMLLNTIIKAQPRHVNVTECYFVLKELSHVSFPTDHHRHPSLRPTVWVSCLGSNRWGWPDIIRDDWSSWRRCPSGLRRNLEEKMSEFQGNWAFLWAGFGLWNCFSFSGYHQHVWPEWMRLCVWQSGKFASWHCISRYGG